MEIIKENFKIYNASAGSGKTFNLVRNYLQILMQKDAPYDKFSQIAAMTFTNKAANEMKSRVVEALYSLGKFEKSAKDQNYLEQLASETGFSEEYLENKARKILNTILHQYENFHILTIDKFSLKLIRSFARDLDIPNDFEIILNEDNFIEKTVSALLANLEAGKDNQLTKLLIHYGYSNIDSEEKWDYKDALVEFSKVLQDESNIEIIKKIKKIEFDEVLLKKTKNEVQKIGEEFHDKFLVFNDAVQEIYNINPKTTNLAFIISSIKKYEGNKKLPSKDKFMTLKVRNNFIENKFNQDFTEKFFNLTNFYDQNISVYLAKEKFIRSFYKLALLQHLSEAFEKARTDENIIRISEFNALISELIEKEEAPFIYEKLGNRFKHFMLDEFQDTSRMQFMNLVPLIHESISNGNVSLIVGDPKQSIYRFKNGLAEQFVALPNIYNPENDKKTQEKSNFFYNQGIKIPLLDNWRSGKNIVEFNSAFFEFLRASLSDNQKDFYESIVQNPKAEKEGYVYIESLPAKSKSDEDEDEEGSNEKLQNAVNQCLEDGFLPGDICILGNVKKECSAWADHLLENAQNRYTVVSSDSMLISQNKYVKLCIAYFKIILNPTDLTEIKKFAYLYFNCENQFELSEYQSYFTPIKDKPKYNYFDRERFIIDKFGSTESFYQNYESLFGLLQGFLKAMKLNELSLPHVHYLSDIVHNFEIKRGSDLDMFLQEYEANKDKYSLQMPENEMAIKIMTIHKSKGLEFPVVIMPNLNFKLNVKGKKLIELEDVFCHTDYTKSSLNSTIKELYDLEYNQVYTDSVNKIYVGFTRPVERLYVFNWYKDAKGIGLQLNKIFNNYPTENSAVHKTETKEKLILEIGERTKKLQDGSRQKDQTFKPKNLNDRLWFPDISLIEKDELDSVIDLSDERRYGNQFHLLLSKIEGSNFENQEGSNKYDKQIVLNELIISGKIEDAFKDKMLEQVKILYNNPDFNNLFVNAKRVLNEQNIIAGENDAFRPDKIILKKDETIILDYKTGAMNSKYNKQLSTYVNLLKQMELPNVKAFIYLTTTNELIQV